MKFFEKLKNRIKKNNEGMTLVEVLVSVTLFAIMAGMIMAAANYSIRTQADTEEWNDQTDNQSTYLSQYRSKATVDAAGDPTGIEFSGGGTQYELNIVIDGTVHGTGAMVSIYNVNTQYEYNDEGTALPTNEDVNLRFFRVD